MQFDDDDFDEQFPDELTPFEQIEQARERRFHPTLELCPCPQCGGPTAPDSTNPEVYRRYREFLECPTCDGIGFVGVPATVDAIEHTLPGSLERIAIYAARYREGLPVFHDPVVEQFKWA